MRRAVLALGLLGGVLLLAGLASGDGPNPAAPPGPPPGVVVAPPCDDPDARTTAIVEEVLRRKEAEKKAEEEAHKKQKEAEGTVVGEDLDFKVRWDHGLWAETADKAFRVHVGGRTQMDAVWMAAPDAVMFGPLGTGRIDDAVAFRRARFAMEGAWYDLIQFNMEFDFLNTVNDAPPNAPGVVQTINTPAPTDLWVQFDRLPGLGHLRVGNQKDPISFEHITSSRFLNFMERSIGFDAFIGGINNGFVPGISLFNTYLDKRLFAQVAVTKNNQTVFGFNVGDGEAAYSARVTGLPVWEQEGRKLVHLGVGYQYRDLNDDLARLRARTSVRNGPAALHSSLIDFAVAGISQQVLVPEFVAVWGPWTLQTEYLASWIQGARDLVGRRPGDTAFYQAYYCEVLYMFTGEHRVYDRDMPRFLRVVPFENAFWTRGEDGSHLLGSGAWQLGMRYQMIDLDDRELGVNRGTVHGLTVGLNWFLNPNMKVQWNYAVDWRQVKAADGSDGTVRGFGVRLACDW